VNRKAPGFFVSGLFFVVGSLFLHGSFSRKAVREMKSSSSIARISAAPWLGGLLAHDLHGLPASACPAQLPMLVCLGHERAADGRQDRENDFGSIADFGSMALAGSGEM
jgi:hypothetical protein